MPTGLRIVWAGVAVCGLVILMLVASPDFGGSFRPALGFLSVVFGAMLLTAAYQFRDTATDQVVDVLKQEFGEYFDQDGFSFAPRLVCRAGDRVACFRIGYQNRRAARCVAQIGCWPLDGWSKTGPPHEVPPLTCTIECPGGEVGVVEIPYAVARKWQGQEMIFDIACSAEFPSGKGVRLSNGQGFEVGRLSDQTKDSVLTGALLLTGHLYVRNSSPASMRVVLPQTPDESVPPGAEPRATILHAHAPTI